MIPCRVDAVLRTLGLLTIGTWLLEGAFDLASMTWLACYWFLSGLLDARVGQLSLR